LSLSSSINESTVHLPFLFKGKIKNPMIFAKGLRLLSRVVASRYFIPANALENIIALSDPVVTVGNTKLRFEGFSGCCGIYTRVDIDQNQIEGMKLQNGTTNVDFNSEMLAQLSSVSQSDDMTLEIGANEVTIKKKDFQVVEKKVPLPERWLKGLANSQFQLSQLEEKTKLTRAQSIQLIRSIPKNLSNKMPLFLSVSGGARLAAIKRVGSIQLNGIERLRLLDEIVNYCNSVSIYNSSINNCTAFLIDVGSIQITFMITGEVWRGFSGEGSLLEEIVKKRIPADISDQLRKNLRANDSANRFVLGVMNDLDPEHLNQVLSHLSCAGILGFDLLQNEFFYRELPIKHDHTTKNNPRMKSALAIIQEQGVHILKKTNQDITARVTSKANTHLVEIVNGKGKCSCTWYGKHLGRRGDCKHLLALKMIINNE
ncbi:MAG: hypothetical protein AAF600_22430, partial [Bacteroidota bacterium]